MQMLGNAGRLPSFIFMKFILGKKIEMSQIFDEKGKVIPVTLIEAGPCFVTQVKTKDKDKYESVQIGYEKLKEKKITKNKKNKPYKYIREFRSREELKVGDKIDLSNFKEGDKVEISGISKGKGFQGGVKRHGFHGADASHGTKHEERKIGSIGSAFPQRVIKGRKMPGRMGTDRITIKNLKIVKIDPEKNLMAVKGAIPGHRRTLLEIRV
jgi:large subunit ribosomal protein L3